MRLKHLIGGLVLMIPWLNACNRDLSPLNTPASSSPAVVASCVPQPNLYDDMEAPFVGSAWGGGPGPSYSAPQSTRSTDTAYSCTHSWKIKCTPGNGYGHWTGGYSSSLDQSGGPISLPGATTFEFWYKVDQNITFNLYWNEGTTLGADGEGWVHQFNFVGDNIWHMLSVPVSSFTGAGAGNNTRDTQSISDFWIDYNVTGFVNYPAHTIYLDDIRFY